MTTKGVGENDVHIKESDPKLELFQDVKILILESTFETSILLPSSRVVTAREQKLVKSKFTKLCSTIANYVIITRVMEYVQLTSAGVALVII